METENIMVSVVMLCYNHEKYIRKALEGAINQKTNFRYELLVHDDASTDASAEIIREFEQKYPDIMRPTYQTENQYSKHIPITRTILFPKARGKYIAYCECDDYWCDENKLQKQVDFLEMHPEYCATAHNCMLIDAEGEPLQTERNIYRPSRAHRYTLDRFALGAAFPGQTATILHRTSVIEWHDEQMKSDFYAMRFRNSGDKSLVLRMLLHADIYCFEEFMSAHRVVTSGGDSWTARNHGKNLSFDNHAAAIDFRRYVKKYYNIKFRNQYVIFHTGVACLVKYWRKPTEENKKVYQQLLKEHGGLLKTVFYLIGTGVVSIPLYFARRKEIKKYDF